MPCYCIKKQYTRKRAASLNDILMRYTFHMWKLCHVDFETNKLVEKARQLCLEASFTLPKSPTRPRKYCKYCWQLKNNGKQSLDDTVKYKDIKKSETRDIRGIFSFMDVRMHIYIYILSLRSYCWNVVGCENGGNLLLWERNLAHVSDCRYSRWEEERADKVWSNKWHRLFH